MDQRIYSAHTGKALSVPYNVNSLLELKKWIATEFSIIEKYLVLMTARGSQVKPQYWAEESEIFAFDRDFISGRSPRSPEDIFGSFEAPNIPVPPDSKAINPRTTLKSHISHLRARASWARNIANQSQDIQARIDAINSDIIVLTKSAKIALVNLGNVSRSLQRAFSDMEVLAEKKIASRRTLLERVPNGINVLNSIKIHPVFGKEEQMLGEFFDWNELDKAIEVCSKTHEDVARRINELKTMMMEFIHQGEGLKEEVLAWEVESSKDGGQVREITLIADKIERDFNHIASMHESPAAMSSAIRSYQNHTREYIPNIQATAASLIDNLKAAYDLRASVSQQAQSYLQRLSSAQERMVSIGPELQEADDLFGDSQDSYDLLKEVETLAEGYGEGLQEGFRRGLWKIRQTKRLQKAKEEIALLRSQERQARKAWGEVSANGGVVWSFVDNLSDDDEGQATPTSNGTTESDSECAVTRRDIEIYISEISKSPLFGSIALSLKEHLQILVSSIQTPQIDVATSPLRIHSSDDISLKSREGQDIYEQLLRDKTRAEEKARNFESRVRNLEELLHRQFRSPPRMFSPVPSGSGPTSPRSQMDGFEDTGMMGRSVLRTTSPDVNALQKRVQDLEREKTDLIERFAETEGTKSDLMANLEEQAKLFQAEREDLVRKTHQLEREVGRCETEINRFEEMVPKMESEIDALRTGRQTLLREMNLLQTESGAKIKELEEAKAVAEGQIVELQRDGETAAAEHERIRGEWRKASSAAENAHEEIEKIRRLSEEHKVDQEKMKDLERAFEDAKAELEKVKAEMDAASQEHLSLLNNVREEINTLRDRLVDLLGLEKRKWETDSLLHAVNQKLTSKDQRSTESESTIASLTKETKTLSNQLAKSKNVCAARTLKARDLTQRLYTQHTRCKQLLEALGLQIKAANGSPLIRYGSEKSDYLEPDDLDLLYWMDSTDSDEEADKYSRYLGRTVIDLDAFSQEITSRVREAEKYAKKWQKEARAYRDKAKRYTIEAENKIAYRQFKEGDLALFLPTNNGRPWAAFNVNAPHYFLREEEAHRLGSGRDWLLARITKVEERTVDLAGHPADSNHNPFDLADGLRWYYLDAVEEKPSSSASRELARSMSLQKSELQKREQKKISDQKKRLSQSTPGLIPGSNGEGVANVNVITEGVERVQL